MTDNPYGPDKPCRRTRCCADDPAVGTGHANHLGGAHLDPTDRAHYDGLRIMAAPFRVREACAALMRHVGAYTKPPGDDTTDSLRAMTEIALDAALREIARLGQQVAHASVDADRRERRAADMALDCTEHGRVITDLEAQLTAAHAACDRTEKARLALLGEHQAITGAVAAYDRGVAEIAGKPITVTAVMGALKAANNRAAAAHKRAWATR